MNRRDFLVKSLILGGVALAGLSACSDSEKVKKYSKIAQGSKVIALGDSLTFGYGTTKNNAYPVKLAEKTGWQIINAGINGDTSDGVLHRIDSIIKQKPMLVLLGIGGNDVLRKIPSATTTDNINKTIGKLKAKNIPVVLIAEPHISASAIFGKASDNPIYEVIAKEQDIPLLAGVWSDILSDDKLKSDQIHANADGYALFAEKLYAFLQEIGYA